MPRMFDATNPPGIPVSAGVPDYTMGYTNGAWPSYAAMKAKYPSAIPVSISAIPGGANESWSQGCDGERGDYSPSQAANFSRMKLLQGVVPFEYCSLSDWPAYRAALTQISISPNSVDWILAAYPGNGANLYAGTIGHQYVDHGPYDESVIVTGWAPGRPIAPHPAPAPSPPLPPIFYPGDNVQENVISVLISNGEGWYPSPVPAGNVVSVLVEDVNPDVHGATANAPAFAGFSTEVGPHTPHGSLNFKGGANGTYGAVVWSVA